MKVLVIGSEGQLGTDVCKVFSDVECVRADIDGGDVYVDICDAERTCELIHEQIRPDIVINTAAALDVPRCESEPKWAFAVNAVAARNVAVACQQAGARLVHISTDYVFGNGGSRPYIESDPPAPLNVYGTSKLAGEHLIAIECTDHVIVRTSAIYGTNPCRVKGGRNFIDSILHFAATQPEVKVVTDDIVSPTYTYVLAKQMRLVAEKGEPGLYHMTCNGECSWYEFAQAVFEETGTTTKLVEITSESFPSPVRRPDYSVLQNKHLEDQGLDIMPEWRAGLKAYLAEKGL
jgi:dTDP-4-dehydrorhamnose reductase